MRRFIVLFSCFCLLLLESTKVFAYSSDIKEGKVFLTQAMLQEQTVSEEIMKQSKEQLLAKYENIIDIDIIECNDEILDMVDVRIDNGVEKFKCTTQTNEIEVEKKASLKRIVLANNSLNSLEVQEEESAYYIMSVTGTVKTSTGNKTESGVTLTGNIVWEDGLLINRFIHCSGNRSGAYRGTGTYEAYRRSESLCHGTFQQGFVATSDKSDLTGFDFMLQVKTYAENIENRIVLEVRTSVFD